MCRRNSTLVPNKHHNKKQTDSLVEQKAETGEESVAKRPHPFSASYHQEAQPNQVHTYVKQVYVK